MPNVSSLNVPSCIASQKQWCKKGMDLAAARGFDKVRFSVGLENFPYSTATDWETVPADHLANIVECVTYADSLNLQVGLLLNVAPKRSTQFMNFLGITAADWHARKCPPDEVTEYTAGYIQQIVTACQAISITRDWELLNEPGRGGVGAPRDDDGTYTGDFAALSEGQISSRFATILADITADVNFGSDPVIMVNFEGQGAGADTTYQTEIASVTGATWTTVAGRCDRVGTNCYANFAGIPYVSATVKSAYSTKLGLRLTHMTANAVLNGLDRVVREAGYDRTQEMPPCTHPNTLRQDILDQLNNEAGIVEYGFYSAYNLGDSSDNDEKYYAYNELDNSPLVYAGASVHLSG